MNSLVGYGVSSDSDSDPEDVNNYRNSSTQKELAVTKTRNFLLETGSASSDSEEEGDPRLSSSSYKTQTPEQAPSAASRSTLPAPSLVLPSSNKLPPPPLHTSIDSSVFANPFKAQADQKLNALQKHVPLTIEAKRSHIGGKRVCEAFRKKGRCRFDTKCKFAHDSGFQTPVVPADSHPPAPGSSEVKAGASGSKGQSSHQETEEESEGQKVKKRRVGLSNSLIPPKRALKQYAMQKDRERINMS